VLGFQGDLRDEVFLGELSGLFQEDLFDVIIDDASHLPLDQLQAFRALFPSLLKPGGGFEGGDGGGGGDDDDDDDGDGGGGGCGGGDDDVCSTSCRPSGHCSPRCSSPGVGLRVVMVVVVVVVMMMMMMMMMMVMMMM
jgi:hypothetical protein